MRRSILVLVAALAACAPTPAPVTAPAPAAEGEIPLSVRWFRGSAEQRASFEQAYRLAAAHLRDTARTARGPWGVILDADETILDNSTYQLRRARQGLGFDIESWNAWARERAAPALPGAVEFTATVRSLGGRVVVVTNRDEVVCEDTRANLVALGVTADAVLCRQDTSDKNPRFRAVEAGTAGLPPLQVLLWVGDNIQDFPGLTQQSFADALPRFGRSYIILPNPMYGSWERLPVP